jgi:two-component system, sensor histidine kinase and response regulator
VLVTAFGREEVREEAERLQLDGFLVKPVTKSMIVDTLMNVFADPGSAAAVVPVDEQAGRLRGARILLTEDNEINQQIAVELLEGAGATVRVAGNGREAVQILTDGPEPPPFDLVLMDLQMPEMDGFQATSKLRGDARFASLPIIAMTAHATLEERQRCLAAGMNAHVAKPIDPAHLFETLGRFYQPTLESTPSVGQVAEAEIRDAPAKGASLSTPAAEGGVPSVEGLDTADGLLRVAGNRNLYTKLLRQFAAQQADAATRIADALHAGDHAVAERLAHTVKGVAGNLGAGPVHRSAAALEQAIASHGDAKGVDALREGLARDLEALIGGLRAALGVEPAPPPVATSTAPVDPDALKSLVEQMRKQLTEFDPAAGDVLEGNRALFRALLPDGDFAAFEQHIQGYAFGEAQALLDRAAAARGM